MPPYIITENEIDKLLEVCLESIEEFIKTNNINLNNITDEKIKKENTDSPF